MNKNIKASADIHAGDGGYAEGTQEEYEKFAKARRQSLSRARIRQFEKESGLDIYGLGARRDQWENTMSKFAELIVKECASMAESFHRHQYDFTGNLELHEFIKQHFGVEEN